VLKVLNQLVCEAATALLISALELEVGVFLSTHAHLKLKDSSQAVVRNGYLPPRHLRTSVGDIHLRVPRTRDRSSEGNRSFTSALVPPYHARTRRDVRLTSAFLQSCLTRDPLSFLQVLLGSHVAELPIELCTAILTQWDQQWRSWWERSLATSTHLCWWAGRLPPVAHGDAGGSQVLLTFIVGLYEDGRHELVHVTAAAVDGEDAWYEMLSLLRRRGLRGGPQLANTSQCPALGRALGRMFPELAEVRDFWNVQSPTAVPRG